MRGLSASTLKTLLTYRREAAIARLAGYPGYRVRDLNLGAQELLCKRTAPRVSCFIRTMSRTQDRPQDRTSRHSTPTQAKHRRLLIRPVSARTYCSACGRTHIDNRDLSAHSSPYAQRCPCRYSTHILDAKVGTQQRCAERAWAAEVSPADAERARPVVPKRVVDLVDRRLKVLACDLHHEQQEQQQRQR